MSVDSLSVVACECQVGSYSEAFGQPQQLGVRVQFCTFCAHVVA